MNELSIVHSNIRTIRLILLIRLNIRKQCLKSSLVKRILLSQLKVKVRHHLSQRSRFIVTRMDPGFPRGGANPKRATNFPENCIKIKKIGPGRGNTHPNFYYVDPPLITTVKV